MKYALALSVLTPALVYASTITTASCFWEANSQYEAGAAQVTGTTEASCEGPFASGYATANYGAVRAQASSVWHEYRVSLADVAAGFTQYATFTGTGSGFLEFSLECHEAELTVNGTHSLLVPIVFNVPVEVRGYAHAHGSNAGETQAMMIESIRVYDSNMQSLATFYTLQQQETAVYSVETVAAPEPNHAFACGLVLTLAAAYRCRSRFPRHSGT